MATNTRFPDESYELVDVEEFDALSIEVKPQPSSATSSLSTPWSESNGLVTKNASSGDPNGIIYNPQLDQKWLQGLGKFPAKAHARKVAAQLGWGSGIIFLLGQEEKYYEDSDMGPTFRQRRYFYYMTGADFPGCAVTYDIRQDKLTLYVPRIEPRTVLWFGKVPTREECKAASDVDSVCYIDFLYEKPCPVFKPRDTIFVLHPGQVPPKLDHLKGTIVIDPVHLKPAMDAARVIKTDYEIALIRRANAISSAAHKAVLHNIKRFTNEREIDALFRAYCIAHGAPIQSYPVIAASGTNASTLHYNDNNQSLKGRQLVILDAGAEFHCYASDITRTIPLTSSSSSSSFSPPARAIYRLVEQMQAECIERVRPGARFGDLHTHACEVAVRGLLRLGILRGGGCADAGADAGVDGEGGDGDRDGDRDGMVEEVLARGTVAAFFPHGLGHHVGLEVHDVSGRERLLGVGSNGGGGVGGAGLSAAGRVHPVQAGAGMKREILAPAAVAALFEAGKQREEVVPVGVGRAADAAAMAAAADRRGQMLEEGMVVTVEPGIYFCREYIEGYFLDDPDHAKYIDTEVLDKYWDVGGVRIEDDILVTKDGYENLTWAPKGDEMMKCMGESNLL